MKIVGETSPREENRVRLSEVKDRYGLPVAHVTLSYGPEEKRLIDHAIRFMTLHLEAAGASEMAQLIVNWLHEGEAALRENPKEAVW